MGFTSDWVTANADRWIETLGHLRGVDGAMMAEIGSYEGRSALWFLEYILTGADSAICCIDFWPETPAIERTFDRNTRQARLENRLRKFRGDCWQLASLPGFFDAIYVDGDHRALAALTDAVVAWRALKLGGVLVFDDYGLDFLGGPGPAVGIDSFLRAAAGRCSVLAKKYQVIVQKVAE